VVSLVFLVLVFTTVLAQDPPLPDASLAAAVEAPEQDHQAQAHDEPPTVPVTLQEDEDAADEDDPGINSGLCHMETN